MSDARPVTSTSFGPVRGIQLPGVENYIEIPYGADTGGANRFKPPRRPEPWTEVRDAGSWTTRTAQYPDSGLIHTPRQWYSMQGSNYALGQGEDSLTLNVWTPSSTDGRRRPVVVWIHGGGYSVGHAISQMSDGANFARDHDSVFVSITHRLNAFGYLLLDSIGGDEFRGSGNAGLLDIVAGLRWIQENVAQFGGDPDNVTLVGESGGGGKVSTLLVMPIADGLFHRAMCQSGVALGAKTRAESEAYAHRLIEHLGGVDVSVLMTATTKQILDAQLEIEKDSALPRLGPVIDGEFLLDEPLAIWESGGGSTVPVLTGVMRDEVSVFGGPDIDFPFEMPEGHPGATEGGATPAFALEDGVIAAERVAGTGLSPAVDAITALRPGMDDRALATALISDLIFRYPTSKFASVRADSGRQTWVYQLDWASPLIEPLGAPHSSSVALFFGNDDLVYFTHGLAEGRQLAVRMSGALHAFMSTGSPETDDLPNWPAYQRDDRSVMVFDVECRLVHDPDRQLREALDAIRPGALM